MTKEPERDLDRYGRHDFGRHCLLARRLLNHGISFVQVTHSNYDTHNENFDFHLEQLGEFDRPFACLVEDLAVSGLLGAHADRRAVGIRPDAEHQLPATAATTGRRRGRSCSAGPASRAGHVFGKTDPKGTSVVDGQVDAANLFHTYLQAVGINSTDTFLVDGRETPIADPASGPVKELLT